MEDKKEKKERKVVPTSQVTLLVRALLGGYMVYLAYDLAFKGSGQMLSYASAVVFAVVGALLLVFSVRRIFNGDYDLVDSKGEIIIPDDLPEEEEGFSSLEELQAFGEDLSFLEDEEPDGDKSDE